jgi:hypothetical protein
VDVEEAEGVRFEAGDVVSTAAGVALVPGVFVELFGVVAVAVFVLCAGATCVLPLGLAREAEAVAGLLEPVLAIEP